MAPPNPNTDGLLPAGVSGRLILRSEDKLTLFEQQSRRVISEIQVRFALLCFALLFYWVVLC